MLNSLFKFFRPQAPKIAADALEQAERDFLDHQAAAEYHDAMVTMLAQRISRLTQYAKFVAQQRDQ